MGLSIGQIANTLGTSPVRPLTPPPTGDQSNRIASDDGASSRVSDEGAGAQLRADTSARPTAGFGPGTFSLQGAALATIDRTVEGARQTIPSLEEIRARFQLQAAAERDAFTESQFRDPFSLTGEVQTIESRIPEAAPQAVRFQDAALAAPAEPAVANAAPGNEVAIDPSVAAPEITAVPDTTPSDVVDATSSEPIETRPQPEPTPAATETPEPARPETRLNVLA